MFNLEKKEKFIILFLVALLLAGLTFKSCQRSENIIDAKIKSFNYERVEREPKKININEADIETLMRLDRVGQSLAGRIVEYRNEKGYFRSTEELKKVKGIGDKLFEHIKDEVSVE